MHTAASTSTNDRPTRPESEIGLAALFRIFLKSGLAFGGGIGITALLMEEFVEKRRAMQRSEFLMLYGLGRIVPSGTVTALAVAYGYRYRRFAGTLVSLAAMILPSFVLTILLTVAYGGLASSPAFRLVNLTLMPAALSVILVAGARLAREFAFPSVEIGLGVLAFVAVLVFGLNPSLVLVAGGVLGALTIRTRADADAD